MTVAFGNVRIERGKQDDELIGQDRVQEPTSRPQPSVPVSTAPYTCTFVYCHVLVYGPHEGLAEECPQAISRARPDPHGGDGYLDATSDIISQDRCFQFVPPLQSGSHADIQHSTMAKPLYLYSYTVPCPSRSEARSTISQYISGSRMNTPVWHLWHLLCRPKRWE